MVLFVEAEVIVMNVPVSEIFQVLEQEGIKEKLAWQKLVVWQHQGPLHVKETCF